MKRLAGALGLGSAVGFAGGAGKHLVSTRGAFSPRNCDDAPCGFSGC